MVVIISTTLSLAVLLDRETAVSDAAKDRIWHAPVPLFSADTTDPRRHIDIVVKRKATSTSS